MDNKIIELEERISYLENYINKEKKKKKIKIIIYLLIIIILILGYTLLINYFKNIMSSMDFDIFKYIQ